MDYFTKERMFSYEFRRRVIALFISGMTKRRVGRVAFYLADDSQFSIASRLADEIAKSPEKTEEFFADMKLSAWDKYGILAYMFEEALYYADPTEILAEARKQKS